MDKSIFTWFCTGIFQMSPCLAKAHKMVNGHSSYKSRFGHLVLKTGCIVLAIMFNSSCIFCQTIHYSYDLNGNRTERVLSTEQLKSAMIDFPVKEADKLEPAEKQKDKLNDAETSVRIYPNPTRGILKVEIINLPENARTDLKFYDFSGVVLINQRNLNPAFDLDISRYKDGIYILRITINDVITNWKVIKNIY